MSGRLNPWEGDRPLRSQNRALQFGLNGAGVSPRKRIAEFCRIIILKPNPSPILSPFRIGLFLLCGLLPLRADQFGLFTYTHDDSTVTITRFSRDATGTVEIPGEIDGKPVTRIDSLAFSNCTGLTSVTLPTTITSMGNSVFDGCNQLTSINVQAGNPMYYGDDGVLFDAERKIVILCPEGKTGTYSLPYGVTTIGPTAFRGCTGLTIVLVPSSVTGVGSNAFRNCTGLTDVIVPSNVTSLSSYTFSGCVSLVSITLPSSLTSIGPHVFNGCASLTSIALPLKVTSIGSFCFSNCTNLSSITLPQSITNIGHGAFSSCRGLTSVTLPSSLASISSDLFSSCYGLTSITITSSVTSIGAYAFSNCTGLTSITIPPSVTSIGEGAISGCTGLTSIAIPSALTSIGQNAFYACTGLTSIYVEAGNPVYASDSRVLMDAARTTLILCPEGIAGDFISPSSVTNIGEGAFRHCSGLTSITIPSSILSIGHEAFIGCTGLDSIEVETGNSVYSSDSGVLLNAAGTVLLLCPQAKSGDYSIPISVTSIEQRAFSNCTALTTVTIPSTVTTIGEGAFFFCTGLTNVTLPSGITSIASYVFSDCTGLVHVNIPFGVTSIGEFAFSLCTRLTEITIPPGVTSIGYGAFGACTRLTTVTIPSGLVEIGALAFSGCTALTNVALTTSITTIGFGAFSQCPGLTSITIPSGVSSIAPGTFSDCTGLTNVTLPSSLASIGPGAFSDCTGLTRITIPDAVTIIGCESNGEEHCFPIPAFRGCTSLTNMVFLGNAPKTMEGEFADLGAAFTLYYFSGRTGFSSPTWTPNPWQPEVSFPAVMINESDHPAAAWLLEHGLGYDADLHSDPDADGVDLLTAWALDLDPTIPQQGQMPEPAINENTLSLNFHASRPGITYRAETSIDLQSWSTTGVTQSAPGPDGRSNASIPLDANRSFLRLILEE
jgi:BspA type Leucine rich repeat region (6 copies)